MQHAPRMLYLGGEGFIPDPGVAAHDAYVESCKEFSRKQGHAPFAYVLTPRSKGLEILGEWVPASGYYDATMFFVEGVSADGRAVGRLMPRPFGHAERVVPDLYDAFRGGKMVVRVTNDAARVPTPYVARRRRRVLPLVLLDGSV